MLISKLLSQFTLTCTSRLQDGLAAFQTDHEVLRKVTEERDCLLKEIEYVRSDRDHLLMKTAGQREIIATIQHVRVDIVQIETQLCVRMHECPCIK